MRSWKEVNRSFGTRAELEEESKKLREKIEIERKIWERKRPPLISMRDSTALSVFGLFLSVLCIALDMEDSHGILVNIQLAAFIVRAIEKK